MFKKILIFLFCVFIVIYFIASTINYNLELKVQNMNNDITDMKKEEEEILIDKNTKASKEEASKNKELKENSNVYYLNKDQNETE